LALNQQLADEAVTLLGSAEGIRTLSKTKKTLIISFGSGKEELFEHSLKPYFEQSTCLNIAKNADATILAQVEKQLSGAEQLIFSIHDSRKRPAPALDYSAPVKEFIQKLSSKVQATAVFASPYTLSSLPKNLLDRTILLAYQNSEELQQAAVSVLIGSIAPKGKLPVNVSPYFKNGEGL
jgi:hypothetical protein